MFCDATPSRQVCENARNEAIVMVSAGVIKNSEFGVVRGVVVAHRPAFPGCCGVDGMRGLVWLGSSKSSDQQLSTWSRVECGNQIRSTVIR